MLYYYLYLITCLNINIFIEERMIFGHLVVQSGSVNRHLLPEVLPQSYLLVLLICDSNILNKRFILVSV